MISVTRGPDRIRTAEAVFFLHAECNKNAVPKPYQGKTAWKSINERTGGVRMLPELTSVCLKSGEHSFRHHP